MLTYYKETERLFKVKTSGWKSLNIYGGKKKKTKASAFWINKAGDIRQPKAEGRKNTTQGAKDALEVRCSPSMLESLSSVPST